MVSVREISPCVRVMGEHFVLSAKPVVRVRSVRIPNAGSEKRPDEPPGFGAKASLRKETFSHG
jgi:hypothetical protein